MPGMDGLTLSKEARRLEPNIKIIIASGFPMTAMNDQQYDFADFDFLSKPYRMAEVLKLLRKP
jgi:DNA-binding NtrC family response regulator